MYIWRIIIKLLFISLVGREPEIARMAKLLTNEVSEYLVVYGRRRMELE